MPNLPSAGKAVSMKLQPSMTGFLLDKLTVLTPEIGSSLSFHVANSHEPSTATRIAPHVTARFARSDVGQTILNLPRLVPVRTVFPGENGFPNRLECASKLSFAAGTGPCRRRLQRCRK